MTGFGFSVRPAIRLTNSSSISFWGPSSSGFYFLFFSFFFNLAFVLFKGESERFWKSEEREPLLESMLTDLVSSFLDAATVPGITTESYFSVSNSSINLSIIAFLLSDFIILLFPPGKSTSSSDYEKTDEPRLKLSCYFASSLFFR